MSKERRLKRGNGEGGAPRRVKRKNGRIYWTASFTEHFDPVTKKQVQVTVTRTTREACIRDLAIRRGRWEAGEAAPSGSGTIGELLDKWLGHIQAEGRRARSIAFSKTFANSYVRPWLGDVQLKRLTAMHVQQWVNQRAPAPRKRKEGRGSKGPSVKQISPVTSSNALGVLKSALTWAVKMELIPASPAAFIRPPRHEYEVAGRQKPPPKFIGAEQVGKLLAAARAEADPLEAYFCATFLVGLRPSEGLGLTWYDERHQERGGAELIEDAAGKVVAVRLRIRSTLLKHPETKQWALEGTKTEQSDRELLITEAAIVEPFRRRKAQQAAAKLKAGDLWSEPVRGLVFTGGLGHPVELGRVRRTLRRLGKKAGIPTMGLTPYSGRHSSVSNSLSAGASLEQVSKAVGHSSAVMTSRVYSHAIQADLDATADFMVAAGTGKAKGRR